MDRFDRFGLKRRGLALTLMGAAGLMLGCVGPAAAQDDHAGQQQEKRIRIGGRAGTGAGGLHVQVQPPEGGVQSYVVIKDGDKVEVELRDGNVVKALRNGKKIPADRIVKDDDTLKIVDAGGNTEFEMDLKFVQPPVGSGLSGGFGDGGWSWSNLGGGNDEPANPAAPPKVLVGISMADVPPALLWHLGLEPGKATMVTSVFDDLPAARAGIAMFDVIVAVDGKDAANEQAVRDAVQAKEPGDRIKFTIIHRGQRKDAEITVEAYDAKKAEKARTGDGQGGANDEERNFIKRLRGAQPSGAGPWGQIEIPRGALIGRLQGQGPDATRFFRFSPDSAWPSPQQLNEAQRHAAEEMEKAMQDHRGNIEQQMQQMQNRLDHLEKLLEKLTETKGKQGATSGTAKPGDA